MTLPVWLFAAASLLLLAACTPPPPEPAPAPVSSPAPASEQACRGDGPFTAEITNKWWPMPVGRQWAHLSQDGERTVITVTPETRKLASGVEARVVRDVVLDEDGLIEDTLDFFYQTPAGDLCYGGEETTSLQDDGSWSKKGSWEAGIDGAQAGLYLPAKPVPGQAYEQEQYTGHAEDRGQILMTNGMFQPEGDEVHSNVLVTADTSPLEPTIMETKFYDESGPLGAVSVSGEPDREWLVKISQGTVTGPLGQPKGYR